MDALIQLGMVSEQFPSEAQNSATSVSEAKDYFVSRDGVKFAGTHLIIDLWDATNLADPEHIDDVLREAAVATGATILHGHFHHFGPNSGVSACWCWRKAMSPSTHGRSGTMRRSTSSSAATAIPISLPVLKRGFQPGRVQLAEHKRGLIG